MREGSGDIEDVYEDRNTLIYSYLIMLDRIGYKVFRREDKENEHYTIIGVVLDSGQVSWHVPIETCPETLLGADRDVPFDGHDRDTKNERLKDTFELMEEDEEILKYARGKINIKKFEDYLKNFLEDKEVEEIIDNIEPFANRYFGLVNLASVIIHRAEDIKAGTGDMIRQFMVLVMREAQKEAIKENVLEERDNHISEVM